MQRDLSGTAKELLELRKALETTEAKLMESRQEEERLKLYYEANVEELSIKVNLQLISSNVCINEMPLPTSHDRVEVITWGGGGGGEQHGMGNPKF